MRSVFGAKRCAPESSTAPWPRRHLPPLVSRHNGQLVVVGQRKWAVQGGFPHLCHGGLSLLEAVVPFNDGTQVVCMGDATAGELQRRAQRGERHPNSPGV